MYPVSTATTSIKCHYHPSLVLHEADGEVVEDGWLVEVGEAGEVVLPDEDVGVAQRRQVRKTSLERDRDLLGSGILKFNSLDSKL